MGPEMAGKSDVALLYSLLRRHGAIIENNDDATLKLNKERDKAPPKVEFFEDFYQINIGVGRDNTVSIYLCQDDVDAINEIIKSELAN